MRNRQARVYIYIKFVCPLVRACVLQWVGFSRAIGTRVATVCSSIAKCDDIPLETGTTIVKQDEVRLVVRTT